MGIKDAVTANEMRLFDDWIINFIGIPGIILMENAGRAVAEDVYQAFFAKKKGYDQVDIFSGTGNNGGDGLVAARHLIVRGITVRVFIVGGVSGLSADSELNFRILRKMGVIVHPILSEKDVSRIKIGKKAVIIDALFGVGLNKDIIGAHREMIDVINGAHLPVVSVDIPSGLNANTGEDWGCVVKATRTVTLVYPKKAFFTKKGKEVVGQLVVADIGVAKKNV